MKATLSVLFCKKAKEYSLYGVHEEDRGLFANPASTPQAKNEEPSTLFPAADMSIQTNTAAAEQNIPSRDDHEQSTNDSVIVSVKPMIPQVKAKTNQSTAEFIAKCISQGYTIDMLLQNFIASIMTFYEEDYEPTVEQVLLIPILLNTLCMTYTQYKLVINSFIKARSAKNTENNSQQMLSIRHQIQALAGLLSSIETGIRWYFNIIAVFDQPDALLKSMLAGISGSGKGGSFLMVSGHAACDLPFGTTLVGKLLYGILTSPIMPDFITYIMTSTPTILGVTYFSSVTAIKENLEIENVVLTYSLYVLAFFVGVNGFILQKSFGCDVIRKNVGKNITSVEEWNKFWYGESGNANALQMTAYAIKRFIDILGAIPLTAIDVTDKVLSVCCYFVLAILPIQIIALCQYVSQPALTYWVYYQVFHNTEGLIKTYTGKDTEPLSQETQYLATIMAIPLGFASAFAVLNVTGGEILKSTNAVFNDNSENVPASSIVESVLLPHQDVSSNNVYGRLGMVVKFAKKSVESVVQNFTKQVAGKNGLKNI